MGISRASLGRGPAIVTYAGATLFTRDDLVVRHAPTWAGVATSMYGEVDKVKTDLMVKIPLRLWSSWENLAVLFPSYVMNPAAGTSVYGTADVPLVILARNGDQITYANAQLTKVSDLYLGVDSELWAADVEFTALLANSANPEAANAYYTLATGVAYTDSTFAKTNFRRTRWAGAWGAVTGFTTLVAQKGWNISWDLRLRPVPATGFGTVDFTVETLVGRAKFVPIGPTLAQLEAQANAQLSKIGALLSAATSNAADLVITGSAGGSLTLKNAGLQEHGYAFGIEPLRIGELVFSTTRGFAAGVPAAVAAVS